MNRSTVGCAGLALDRDLVYKLEKIERSAVPFLGRILVTFPQYTDHGPDHSRRIIELLHSVILDADNLEYLRTHSWTYLFLLASAYLHDIGMVDFPELRPKGTPSMQPTEIRRVHSQRSAKIIRARWRDFGLDDEFQAVIISEIAEHHCGPLEARHFVSSRAYGTEAVNVGFCTACLRLADELDLPKDRADRRLEEFVTDAESKGHWQNHYSIGGVIRHPNLRQVVLVECYCKDKAVHRRLKSLETKINKLFGVITTHLEPRLQYAQCNFEITTDGYVDKDLRFEIDGNSLWPMIIGDIVYHDNRTFIRELVQNAIDACLLRRARDPAYEPRILLSYDDSSVKVADNGTGMDMGTIEKYLVRICVSFYGSERFAQESELLRYFPISRFGIGIFSCFMVAERLDIKTSTGSGVTYYLSTSDFRDYVHLEERHEQFTGTEVTVKLNTTLSDVIRYVRDTFRHTDLAITYRYPLGDEEIVGRRPMSKTELVAFGLHEYEGAKEYRIPFSSSEGLLWFFDKTSEGGGRKDNGNFLLLMNGISVGRFNLLPHWCTLQRIEGVLNLRDMERIDVTASRTDVVRNEKYEALVLRIEDVLLKVLSDVLEPRRGNPSRIRRLFQSAVDAGQAVERLLPLVEEYYFFSVATLRQDGGEFVGTGKERFMRYHEANEHFSGRSDEYKMASLDLYDRRLIKLGIRRWD